MICKNAVLRIYRMRKSITVDSNIVWYLCNVTNIENLILYVAKNDLIKRCYITPTSTIQMEPQQSSQVTNPYKDEVEHEQRSPQEAICPDLEPQQYQPT